MSTKHLGIASIAVALSSLSALAEPTSPSPEKSHSASSESRKSQSTIVLRAVPIQDHWNANSWDPAGGSLFWHAVKDQKSTSGRNLNHPRSSQSEKKSAKRP